ncbi:hypothetical protein LCGC14_2707250, partial [marine sediment metagenome]
EDKAQLRKERKKARDERAKAKEKEESEGDEDKCPHGFEFGAKKDCEKHDECDKCEVWDDCVDEMEKK